MAGAAGFEPADADTKNRCLTTWRRPNRVRATPYSEAWREGNHLFLCHRMPHGQSPVDNRKWRRLDTDIGQCRLPARQLGRYAGNVWFLPLPLLKLPQKEG